MYIDVSLITWINVFNTCNSIWGYMNVWFVTKVKKKNIENIVSNAVSLMKGSYIVQYGHESGHIVVGQERNNYTLHGNLL